MVTLIKKQRSIVWSCDYVGLRWIRRKIKGGWTDVDDHYDAKCNGQGIGALGRVLWATRFDANPKSGTVTMDVAKAVAEVKAKIN